MRIQGLHKKGISEIFKFSRQEKTKRKRIFGRRSEYKGQTCISRNEHEKMKFHFAATDKTSEQIWNHLSGTDTRTLK